MWMFGSTEYWVHKKRTRDFRICMGDTSILFNAIIANGRTDFNLAEDKLV
jgi:hypothetical protein